MEDDPHIHVGQVILSVVLQQCTNHNVETAHQIYQIETCLTIQSYSPGGATFSDCFASFSNPVAMTTVAWSAVFPAKFGWYETSLLIAVNLKHTANWATFGLVLIDFWVEISTSTWQHHWPSRCSRGGPARSLQPGQIGYHNPGSGATPVVTLQIDFIHSAPAIGTWTVQKEFEIAILSDFLCCC